MKIIIGIKWTSLGQEETVDDTVATSGYMEMNRARSQPAWSDTLNLLVSQRMRIH